MPGTLQAYEESPIYARTNGYLLRWYKDIGSRVTKGELLADIDTPEVDQELMQVARHRQQIAAQMDLAKINADRYRGVCARPTRFRSRKPISRPAAISRPKPTLPQPTPTSGGWRNWNPSSTCTRPSPACSPSATSIPAR